MPLKLKKHSRAILPLVALVLSANACAVPLLAAETEPYEFFTGVDRSSWCVADEHAWMVGEDAVIRGPHFAVGIQCRFLSEKLPHEVAEQAPGLAELPRAADGSEFVITQFSLETTPTDPDGLTRAWVQVGDQEFELAEVPKARDWVAFTAPVDETAVLWVEDDGRAQGLDLREGSRVDPVASIYNGLAARTHRPLGDLSYKIDIVGDTESYWISCDCSVRHAMRASWKEGLGWAADGRVFLTVGFGWCSGFGDLGIEWALDHERVLAIEGADPAGPLIWEESATGDGGLEIEVTFSVPADDPAIDVAFTPFGELTSEDGRPFENLDELEATELTAEF